VYTTNHAIAPLSIILSLASLTCIAVEPATFKEHVLADDLTSGYQVEVSDVNRDGMPDLIAVDSRAEDLVWFEGPNWERHVLSSGMTRMIYMGVCDGHYVVAQKFSNRVKDSIGEIVVINEDGTKNVIDKIPTSHRIRCADIDGSGNEVVINAPLTGLDALAPDYRDNVPLVYYKPGDWQRQVIGDENEGVMHGIYIYDWDGNGRDDVMTASFSGIHVYSFENGWQRTEITRGNPGDWPLVGSSDLAVGHAGSRYVASIEPFHGNQVAVYQDDKRLVIDDTINQGHTITTADLNNDGHDEIIAGDRGEAQSVFVYYREGDGWIKTILDDGDMSAATCISADLNNDGLKDIACIGRTTENLKWYENLGVE
jgi:hypothetical protein